MILLLSVGWFTFLWGLSVPSLVAGAALSVLAALAIRRGSSGYTARREASLRQRLGGEMALEELMLARPRQAHFRAGMMLAVRYPLRMERLTESGLLCRDALGPLLVCCLCAAPQGTVSASALLPCLRAASEMQAERIVVCSTASFGKDAVLFTETYAVPVRLIDREALLPLAGRLCPASDEQLAALARRKRSMPARTLVRTALARGKARRYMGCGLSLAVIYIVTGLRFYCLPGLMSMVLAALCRADRRSEPEHL